MNEQRGVYFELRDRAPGPMLNTMDEVAEAVAASNDQAAMVRALRRVDPTVQRLG